MKRDGYCRQNLGVVRPRMAYSDNRALPYSYKWRDTLEALTDMAAAERSDPHDGVLLEYTHPLTGGPTMPTIGCWAQLVPPGMTTRPQRHTSSAIYHVIQGEGITKVGEKENVRNDLSWGARDCFFVPSWHWYQFTNKSRKEPAIMFSVTDRPVLESVGLFREERG
jgi:gentisate 1,2-dioxygenase/1-hydroxy-2-naphthoate dioxygenase